MKVRIKENGTLFSEGMKWKIQYLLKLKTHLVSFVFGFRYQISDKSKNKRFRFTVDLEPVKKCFEVDMLGKYNLILLNRNLTSGHGWLN